MKYGELWKSSCLNKISVFPEAGKLLPLKAAKKAMVRKREDYYGSGQVSRAYTAEDSLALMKKTPQSLDRLA